MFIKGEKNKSSITCLKTYVTWQIYLIFTTILNRTCSFQKSSKVALTAKIFSLERLGSQLSYAKRKLFKGSKFPKRFLFSKYGNWLYTPKILACTLYWQKINCGCKWMQKKGFSTPCTWQVVIISIQMQLVWSVITFKLYVQILTSVKLQKEWRNKQSVPINCWIFWKSDPREIDILG